MLQLRASADPVSDLSSEKRQVFACEMIYRSLINIRKRIGPRPSSIIGISHIMAGGLSP